LKILIQLKSYLFSNVNIVVIVLDKISKVKTKLRQIKRYIKLIFFYKNINWRHNLTEKRLQRWKKNPHSTKITFSTLDKKFANDIERKIIILVMINIS